MWHPIYDKNDSKDTILSSFTFIPVKVFVKCANIDTIIDKVNRYIFRIFTYRWWYFFQNPILDFVREGKPTLFITLHTLHSQTMSTYYTWTYSLPYISTISETLVVPVQTFSNQKTPRPNAQNYVEAQNLSIWNNSISNLFLFLLFSYNFFGICV